MEQEEFIDIVKQYPQIWDRSHPLFREKNLKDNIWDEVGSKCGKSGASCKEWFKALREKYLREREKGKQLGTAYYVPWKLLSCLSFLEPHIVLRKQGCNSNDDLQAVEEFSSKFTVNTEETNTQEFDINLIQIVKNSAPIWNRNCKTFSSKQVKMELWRSIANKLKRNPNTCMLRWKALREKYIREKLKYQEGEGKWYYLDEMSFLDEVIHYRKRVSNRDFSSHNEDSSQYSLPLNREDTSTMSDSYKYKFSMDSENSITDSSNDFVSPTIKQEQGFEIPDSSNDVAAHINNISVTVQSRKRSLNTSEDGFSSDAHDGESEAKQATLKAPHDQDQLFGNLVAVMLSKKPEKEKNAVMMEIMKILTK